MNKANDSKVVSEVCKPVHDLISKHALSFSDSVALVQDDEFLTYAELDSLANGIAQKLLENGVAAETPVVVLSERSLQTIVVFLAIFKAGGTYVPIDATSPLERISFMIHDCNARCVLAHTDALNSVNKIEDIKLLDLDSIINDTKPITALEKTFHSGPHHRAYIIYTSGSTGKPKGVEIEHHSLSNLIAFYKKRLGLSKRDRIPLTASIAFDVSVAQIWATLASGATVYIPPEDLLIDATGYREWIGENGITITDAPTRMGEMLFEERWPEKLSLRTLITGGAALRKRPPSKLPFEVINAYGPTENTVDSTWSVVQSGDISEDEMPAIGFPIENVITYIVDENLEPVKAGEAGELLLGGEQVARGYLNREKLTKEKFFPDHISDVPRGRLYRTGDKVRLKNDGELEFLGRIDDQIQLRGFRIELGEIECALLKHPEVNEAYVCPLPNALEADELAAYVGGPSQESVDDLLRPFLAEMFQEYMIPATFTVMDKLPRNLSGKVDRHALPQPYRKRNSIVLETEKPKDEIECCLAAIWQEMFGGIEIGIDDNFFDMGGSSLLILRLISKIQRELNEKITPATLLRGPTIRELAQRIRGITDDKLPSCVMSMLDSGGSKRPIFCISGGGGGAHWFHPVLPYLDPDRPFYVLDFLGLDDELNANASVTKIAAVFLKAVKEVQPEGPYLLGGFSLGGIFAWELSRQLQAQGDKVPLLFLLDQYGPGIQQSFWPKLRQYIRNFFALSWKGKLKFFYDKYRWIVKNVKFKLARGETKQQQTQYREVMQSHLDAVNSYTPPIRNGVLDIFRSEHPPRSAPPDPYAGWGGYASNGIVIHKIPGNHFSMFQSPNNKVFAQELEKCVARTEEI